MMLVGRMTRATPATQQPSRYLAIPYAAPYDDAGREHDDCKDNGDHRASAASDHVGPGFGSSAPQLHAGFAAMNATEGHTAQSDV